MQQHDRDTQGWAVKCSNVTLEYGDAICKDGEAGSIYEDRDVFKDPITGPSKKSKKGKVITLRNPTTGEYFISTIGDPYDREHYQVMHTVFKDGKACNTTTLSDIRERSNG